MPITSSKYHNLPMMYLKCIISSDAVTALKIILMLLSANGLGTLLTILGVRLMVAFGFLRLVVITYDNLKSSYINQERLACNGDASESLFCRWIGAAQKPIEMEFSTTPS